jgi:hypothetical protein
VSLGKDREMAQKTLFALPERFESCLQNEEEERLLTRINNSPSKIRKWHYTV